MIEHAFTFIGRHALDWGLKGHRFESFYRDRINKVGYYISYTANSATAIEILYSRGRKPILLFSLGYNH
jgi:hypothetical protein